MLNARPKVQGKVLLLPVDKIAPNPRQPRRRFEEQPLRELADSIRQHGVLQPLTVQRTPEGYVLVAGERRLRAAAMAGLTHVPCILVRATEEDSALLALIENLQRCDLHYLEEAAAIARLITTYGLSQEEAARRLGRSQSAVANKLRLLRLPPEALALLREHGCTERHARALLRLEGEQARMDALQEIIRRQMNVAATEQYIDRLLEQQKRPEPVRRSLGRFLLRDVRLFLNTVEHNLDLIKNAGISAAKTQEETDQEIVLTIRIPKHAG